MKICRLQSILVYSDGNKETSIKIAKEVTSRLEIKSLDKILISFKDISDKVWVKELKKFLHSLGRERVLEILKIQILIFIEH